MYLTLKKTEKQLHMSIQYDYMAPIPYHHLKEIYEQEEISHFQSKREHPFIPFKISYCALIRPEPSMRLLTDLNAFRAFQEAEYVHEEFVIIDHHLKMIITSKCKRCFQ